MFPAPPEQALTPFARMPDDLRITGRTPDWVAMQRRGAPTDCFLEGPAFDRDGALYCVDIPYGRILRVDAAGRFQVAAAYDGEPNGLAIHRDGRVFIADHKQGILALDPPTGEVAVVLDRPMLERFKGVNDLVFTRNGDLYFTDQGQTGLHDPAGRVYRLRADGGLDLVLDGVPSPNGLGLSPDESVLYLCVTRANAIWRVPLLPSGKVTKVGMFIQLSGGTIGPDGMAVDSAGNLAVCHAGLGTVWLFSPLGEPIRRLRSSEGLLTTNVCYGGRDGRRVYVTESETGTILTAELETPGLPLLSHL